MTSFVDKLVFPAPSPTYTKDTFKKHLCWIPWNEAVSPDRMDDERYAEGIPCMWLPAPRAAGVILFCHGNAEDLGMCFPFVRHMRDQFKMNVLAVEYPGYGLLHGVAVCEAALKEVALTAFRFILDELKVAYEQIILFGRSVGSGPTVYLASRFPVGGLILVAAFASVREAARSLVGSLIAHILDERFPNIALIGNVSCPTLFIHGEKDSLVPPSHSVALFKSCRARKLLITPPGMEHNTNLFTDAQFLAVPAINFFGLPGYQQESPPQMPARFFEDGRQAFLLRKSSRRKKDDGAMPSNPWFFLCGCPTTRARARGEGPAMEHQQPQRDRQPQEWDPDRLADYSLEAALGRTAEHGDPASAAREPAASRESGRGGAAMGDSGRGGGKDPQQDASAAFLPRASNGAA
jgi:pimeloyl-ACP methyl ester carboxylesterase